MVSVRDHGAVGDGATDDTGAFLAAVSEAKATSRQIYVPRGTYRISQSIPLDGIGLTGPHIGAWPADIDALPSIRYTHSEGPAVHLLAGGSLSWVDLTCDNQGAETAAVVVSGIGAYISNCRIRYPWDGIITDGVANVGRLNIDNVFMVSPRHVGVRVTGTWDVPALRNVEVWNAGPVPQGLESGIGFHLGKNDLIRLTDCFAFAMRWGFLIEDEIEGCEIKGGTWGTMSGCASDYCVIGIEVRGENTLSIAGGTFWDHAESLIVTGEGARVRIAAAELKSNSAPAIRVDGGEHTVVTGCSILSPMEEYAPPAVVWNRGRLVLADNMVDSVGPGIRIGPEVAGGVVRGNYIRARGPAIASEYRGDLVLAEGNLEETSG